MSRTASWLALFPLVIVTGCGGSGTSAQGSVGGKSLSGAHAVSNVNPQPDAAAGIVVISNADNLCGQITADTQPMNAQILSFEMFEIDATNQQSSAPGHTGAYTIVADDNETGGQFALAYFSSFGAVVTDATQTQATAGTVTLSDIAGGKYSGSFDLTFGADHLKGNFESSNCPGLKI